MRVLVISHLYPSAADTAAGLFVHDQVRELANLGCDVRVISPTLWAPPVPGGLQPRWAARRAVPVREEVEGIPVWRPRFFATKSVERLGLAGWLCFYGIRRCAEQLHQEFDAELVHAHTVLPDGFAAMLLNRRWLKPLVMTVHGYDTRLLRHGGARRSQIIRGMHAADRVICVSEKLRQECLCFLPQLERFQVVYSGFRTERLRHLPQESAERPAEPLLLTVASLIPLKGHPAVLHAVAALHSRFPRIGYRVVGDGPSRVRLEALARRLRISDHVQFLGKLPNERVMLHYAACDIYVMPSAPEGLPIAYLEAMAHGKPIIASEGQGISELVEDGQTGLLVPPHDAAAVANAIRRLAEDRETSARLGKAGRRVAAHLTWRLSAERLMQIYREVLGLGGVRGP